MYDTIINSEDENFKFDEKIFTKNENKNDFAENQILSSMIDNGGVKCEEINLKVIISKLEIAQKECYEAEYWLELLFETESIDKAK